MSEAGSWRSPSGLSDCAVSEHCSAPSTLSSSWMRYSSGAWEGGTRSPVPEELAPSWPSPRLRDCAKFRRTASASDPIWFERADSEPESGGPGLPPERTWTPGEPRSYGSGSYRPETDGAEDEGGVALNGPRFTVLGTVRERASRAPRKMPEKLRLPFGGAMDDEVDAMAYLTRVNYPMGSRGSRQTQTTADNLDESPGGEN